MEGGTGDLIQPPDEGRSEEQSRRRIRLASLLHAHDRHNLLAEEEQASLGARLAAIARYAREALEDHGARHVEGSIFISEEEGQIIIMLPPAVEDAQSVSRVSESIIDQLQDETHEIVVIDLARTTVISTEGVHLLEHMTNIARDMSARGARKTLLVDNIHRKIVDALLDSVQQGRIIPYPKKAQD